MSRNQESTSRKTRIPHRIINQLYGTNSDTAGDDIIESLQLVSEYPNQHRYRFDSDLSHPNPWYHEMIFEIDGISTTAYERFLERLTSLGLAEKPEGS